MTRVRCTRRFPTTSWLTEALSTGLLAMLQSLLASVAQEAYAAGQEAERQQKQPVQVDDADIIEAT